MSPPAGKARRWSLPSIKRCSARKKPCAVIANIGGMTNISVLDGVQGSVIGFDTGPGNVLLDAWAARHLDLPFDADGAWAQAAACWWTCCRCCAASHSSRWRRRKARGAICSTLPGWHSGSLHSTTSQAADIQATLTALTAHTLADAIAAHAPGVEAVYVCGGGACNGELLRRLQSALSGHGIAAGVFSTTALGIAPNHVEALAFAWLAQRFDTRRAGNLPAVTGANGPRILGALYPA